MSTASRVQPSLLGKINERQVLRVLQTHGPLSRAEVARRLGLSAPTVSKAVASLLRAGLLEESEAPEQTLGRPATRLRLATQTAQVLGIVIDADQCRVVPAGLDGKLREDRQRAIRTPNSYEKLLEALVAQARDLMGSDGVSTLGIGVSMPGLIDHRQQRGVLSPNVPVTNGHAPALDLGRRLGVECVLIQESRALCLAERYYGNARGLDDFAMLDVNIGVGLGVLSGGRLLVGHQGLAGEIGHIPLVEDGRPCGCGNRGCLETVASDASFAWRVSRRLGRKVTIDRAIELARSGKAALAEELEDTCRYLAVGVAAVINLFNPSTLFIHGRIFEADAGLFGRLVERARARTLPPSFAACRIVQARGSKRQGAVAGIIQHLTSSIGPALESKSL
jgi:N-acetylglucosamine repressor